MIQCVSTHVAWKCFELACQISLKKMEDASKYVTWLSSVILNGMTNGLQCTKPEKSDMSNLPRKRHPDDWNLRVIRKMKRIRKRPLSLHPQRHFLPLSVSPFVHFLSPPENSPLPTVATLKVHLWTPVLNTLYNIKHFVHDRKHVGWRTKTLQELRNCPI